MIIINIFIERFKKAGLTVDTATLDKSWRCSPSVCNFVTNNLEINIASKSI